jgi:hypothetical protein
MIRQAGHHADDAASPHSERRVAIRLTASVTLLRGRLPGAIGSSPVRVEPASVAERDAGPGTVTGRTRRADHHRSGLPSRPRPKHGRCGRPPGSRRRRRRISVAPELLGGSGYAGANVAAPVRTAAAGSPNSRSRSRQTIFSTSASRPIPPLSGADRQTVQREHPARAVRPQSGSGAV